MLFTRYIIVKIIYMIFVLLFCFNIVISSNTNPSTNNVKPIYNLDNGLHLDSDGVFRGTATKGYITEGLPPNVNILAVTPDGKITVIQDYNLPDESK